jgi:hypothetical protein
MKHHSPRTIENAKSRKALAAPPPPLSEKEWNFDSVPSDQLEACYFYEYSREYFKQSPALQTLRDHREKFQEWWCAQKNKFPHPPVPKKHQNGFLAPERAARILELKLGHRVPFDFQSFPAVNWQDLGDLTKTLGIEMAEERAAKKKDTPRFIPKPGEFCTFEVERPINLHWPLPKIQQAIRQSLEARAGMPPAPPSRGQFKDKLRWLGALRVKNHYRYSDLVDYPESQMKVKAPYKHYPDLMEAAKKAKGLILEMFPSENEAAQIASKKGPRTPAEKAAMTWLNR